MSTFLYWFGLIHVVAYAIAGFIVTSAWFINWAVHRFKLKADLLQAMMIMFKRRKEAKDKTIPA